MIARLAVNYVSGLSKSGQNTASGVLARSCQVREPLGMTQGLTERQSRVLQAIKDLSAGGHSPSYDEIAEATGMKSRGQVSFQLNQLKNRGLIEWEPNKARSLRVIDQLSDPAALAGKSAEALQEIVERTCDLLAERMGPGVDAAVLEQVVQRLRART